jgi:N6-adenosine-specific RNA methylase IME4
MTYGVIYADPPWKFGTYSDKGLGRSAEAWYDCMSLDDIKAMNVAELAAPDCVLLMWVTDPFLRLSFDVIDAWGFTYKTVGFYWAKRTRELTLEDAPGTDLKQAKIIESWPIGTGYWTRANPEQCLLATRGHPKRLDNGVPKLIVAPRREHSRKPDEAYERIERLCTGPYMELFARQRRPGWDCLGLEADSGPGVRRWASGRIQPGSVQLDLDDL